MRFLLTLSLTLFYSFQAHTAETLPHPPSMESRESDPASLVENVSAIYGSYSEFQEDVIVLGPDSLALSRRYSSQDILSDPYLLGGWRFNPHCFLYVIKEAQPRTYTTADGKFESTRILIGTDTGSILNYTGWKNTSNQNIRSSFKLDIEGASSRIVNTARQNINAWTNQKNHQLCFEPTNNHYELVTSSGGKRVYTPSSSNANQYLLTQETLPSGNKIFYEYEEDLLSEIKMTNPSEEKVISWIRIQYGASVHIETSDRKSIDYYFDQETSLLSQVTNSHKPTLQYNYRIVDEHPLLVEKHLPEGRSTKIQYYTDGKNRGKVESIQTSASDPIKYIYSTESDGSGFTKVDGPNRKKIYYFDDRCHLTSIEEYLGERFLEYKEKLGGEKKDASNLIGVTTEDGGGGVYSYKTFTYDDRGNIVEEKETVDGKLVTFWD